jgi:4,5-DOPA dioxygenase extradiol
VHAEALGDRVKQTIDRMPVAFFGHGTPMNAISDNQFTKAWERFGRRVKPQAIVVISAHWCTEGVSVTAMARPRTIHDFGNFPEPLFKVSYPAPGSPALAERICELLSPIGANLDQKHWGFDHGTWSILVKAYPSADVPVVQLSVDYSRSPRFHFEVGRLLRPLREEGVLILGSGNVVHNLEVFRRQDPDFKYDWAIEFNDYIRKCVELSEFERILDYEAFGRAAALSVPTPDHFFPLLYVLGAAGTDTPTIEIDGVYQGSISMLSVSYGTVVAPAGRSAATLIPSD